MTVGVRTPSTLTNIAEGFAELLKSVRLPLPAALFLLAVVFPVGFALGPLSMNPVRLLLLILIVPLVFNLLQGKYGPVNFTDALFFVHVLWVILALTVNNPDRVVQFAGSTSLEFLGGYLVARACIRDQATFVRMVRMLAFIIVCLFPFVVYETLTGVSLIIKLVDQIPGLKGYHDTDAGMRMGLHRVQAVFLHPIHFGMFSATLFSLCFIGMRNVFSVIQRFGVTAIVAMSGYFALSSGAVMAFVLQSCLILWAWLFRKVRARWVILVALMAVAYVVVDAISNRTPVKVFLSYATFSPETAYWRTLIFDYGMDNVWANPVFGLGLNDWVRPSWMGSGSIDNFWLVQAVSYGIPGFALIALPYLWALWKIGRRDFDADPLLWQLRRAWMFTFVGLTFTLCTVHVWSSIYSFVFFLFGSGVWMIRAEPDSGGDTPAAEPRGHMRRRPAGSRPVAGRTPVRGTPGHYTRFPDAHSARTRPD